MRFMVITRAVVNAGDFLIVRKLNEVLEKIRPNDTFINKSGFDSFDDEIGLLNTMDGLIIGGGPGYDNRFLNPDNFPLFRHLDEIEVPIHFVGMGWYGKSAMPEHTKSYQFTDAALAILNRAAASGSMIGCRDFVTQRVLDDNQVPCTTMTGCPVWYDYQYLDCLEPRSKTVKKIVLSDPGMTKEAIDHKPKAQQALQLAAIVRERFPHADFIYTFNGGIHTKYSTQCNLNILKGLEGLGIPAVDLTKEKNGFAIYDDADLHVGFRVHSHIYCLSKRIRSILVEEDARGFGVNEALGLPNISAFDPEQISGMQFVPSKTLAQDMDSALDGICTENIEMYCKAFQSMKRTYEEKMRVQIENL